MLGSNVKVHFAGTENGNFMYNALVADVKYILYSPYRFLVNRTLDDDLRIPRTSRASGQDAIRIRQNEFNHIIQDSGLFTLMFNPKVKGSITYEFLENWQDKLIEYLRQNELTATAVEIDCQKLLGVKEAWHLRERMKKKCPNRQINVFHVEDGKEGLNSLLDFSEYIAISVPEIRKVYKGKHIQGVINLASYCKNRKPNIDIHLLGCTELEILKHCTFCTSADSTSWLGGVRYGKIKNGTQRNHVSQINKKLIDERNELLIKELKKDGKEFNSKKALEYNSKASLCATLELKKYINVCGEQN